MSKKWLIYSLIILIFGVTPFIGPVHYLLGIQHVARDLYFGQTSHKIAFIIAVALYTLYMLVLTRKWLATLDEASYPNASDQVKDRARNIIYRFPLWILLYLLIFAVIAPLIPLTIWTITGEEIPFTKLLDGGEAMLLSMIKGFIPAIYVLSYQIEKYLHFVGLSDKQRGFSFGFKFFLGTFGVNLVLLESMRRFITVRYLANPLGDLPMIGFLLTLLIISFIVYFFFSRDIMKRTRDLNQNLKAMTEGSDTLISTIEIQSLDEIGQLSHWFNQLAFRIQGAVIKLESAIQTVKLSGKELFLSIREFSETIMISIDKTNDIRDLVKSQHDIMSYTTDRMESLSKTVQDAIIVFSNQLNSMSQSSNALKSMGSKTKNMAEVAESADVITKELSIVAKQGGESVNKVIQAIGDIENSSREIADIATVINGISEQTNLLAMNAAIEAAHAGDFGKGFAVVADEIRKLAENSGTNAKNISTLLKEIIEKIQNADTLAGEADVGLGKILNDVNRTRDINLNISETIKEQVQETGQLMNSVSKSVDEAQSIKGSFHSFEQHNQELTNSFSQLADIANSIFDSVNKQSSHTNTLLILIQKIEKVTLENDRVNKELQQLLSEFAAGSNGNDLNSQTGITFSS